MEPAHVPMPFWVFCGFRMMPDCKRRACSSVMSASSLYPTSASAKQNSWVHYTQKKTVKDGRETDRQCD